MVGGKIREYLVTGNPDSLNGVPLLTSTKAYKEAVETLMKVTGLDQTKSELTKGIPEDQLPDSKASVTLALSDDGQSELLKMLETQLKNGSE
jgi:hypothetical protein